MNERHFVIPLESMEDTELLGANLAKVLRPGMTLLLEGTLGAGKTTLVRCMCRALGWKRTCSPSFSLVNEYAAARIPVAHADLYRIEAADGRDFGFEDYIDDGWLLLIEWPERLIDADFPEVWKCVIRTDGNRRIFEVTSAGEDASAALEELESLYR